MPERPETARLPVVAGPARDHSAEADPRVSAQVQGQAGQRRGLRGGRPVLEAAREAYLKTEWTGPHDRRLIPGTLRREVI